MIYVKIKDPKLKVKKLSDGGVKISSILFMLLDDPFAPCKHEYPRDYTNHGRPSDICKWCGHISDPPQCWHTWQPQNWGWECRRCGKVIVYKK